ncbi:hypothetical protein JOM56_010289, partial [Amanita muscaria]
MLHNIEQLRLRFNYELDLSQFSPTPLNHLRLLEVPHPAILSWFETPSLCDLSFADCLQDDDDEPLDVHGQISALIQRSGCQIRKLSFKSSRMIPVGTLNDVEELEIHSEYQAHSSIDISSLESLPRLRFLTIVCWINDRIEHSVNYIITALKAARVPPRNECSTCTPINCLERVTVELRYYDCEQPEIPKRLLEIADKWPMV